MDIEKQLEILSWGTDNIISKDELKKKLINSQETNTPLTVKLGVDPTAPDIHLGHTVVLRKLRQFQDLGHKAVLIIGGFTSRIGDPSGKSKTRPPLSQQDIDDNAATYLTQVKKILKEENLEVVDNSQWLDSLTLKETLKILSFGTMSKLLEHNTFKDRFNSSVSIRMHEFIYPFMQAYDSIHLKADVELGGSDQLFNIVFGRDLQKEYGQEPQCALLMPILTGTDGEQKMSKSLDNYIGVTDSPQVMKQKLINMPDKNIIPYLKLLTAMNIEQVKELEESFNNNASTEDILKWKHQLINEIIKIYHPGSGIDDVDETTIPANETENSEIKLTKAIILAGFAKSNREAVQFIESGAVKLAGEKVTDRNFLLNLQESIVLTVGKKKITRLKLA